MRPATAEDLPALVSLERQLFAAEAWSEAALRSELDGPGRSATVAVDGDVVVGYAITMLLGDIVDLQRIGVHPDRQRRGTARRLLAGTLEAARARGANRMLLEVSASNRAAVAFYLAQGFSEIDRRPRYYSDGSDALVLSRSLAGAGDWG